MASDHLSYVPVWVISCCTPSLVQAYEQNDLQQNGSYLHCRQSKGGAGQLRLHHWCFGNTTAPSSPPSAWWWRQACPRSTWPPPSAAYAGASTASWRRRPTRQAGYASQAIFLPSLSSENCMQAAERQGQCWPNCSLEWHSMIPERMQHVNTLASTLEPEKQSSQQFQRQYLAG